MGREPKQPEFKRRIASRFDEAKDEYCPKCLLLTQNFEQLNKHTWVCYNCGTHFTPKATRLQWKETQLDRLQKQEKARLEIQKTALKVVDEPPPGMPKVVDPEPISLTQALGALDEGAPDVG